MQAAPRAAPGGDRARAGACVRKRLTRKSILREEHAVVVGGGVGVVGGVVVGVVGCVGGVGAGAGGVVVVVVVLICSPCKQRCIGVL